MRKNYEVPSIELTQYGLENIIATSGSNLIDGGQKGQNQDTYDDFLNRFQ